MLLVFWFCLYLKQDLYKCYFFPNYNFHFGVDKKRVSNFTISRDCPKKNIYSEIQIKLTFFLGIYRPTLLRNQSL